MKLYDVAVIGGGPVGSRVAYQLADRGYEVVVLERKGRPGTKVCCTGIISQECAHSFAVANDLILKRLNSARLISPSGKVLRLWRDETQACVLDRLAFDMTLAQRARDSGARYIFNSRVKNLKVSSDKVSLEVIQSGERVNISARAAVIACGFNSNLVEKLGLGRVSYFVIGAQAEVETPAPAEMEVYFSEEIAPGFFAWLVPISTSRARLGLLSRQRPGPYLKKLLKSLTAQGKIAPAVAELSYGRVPLKPLARTCYDRLLIVGAAAGQVKPTTGGGIYYGLLCADIAASTLHQALAGNDLSARGLASYELKWRKRLGVELKKGYQIRKFYDGLSDRQIDKLFATIEASYMAEVLLKDGQVSFDWHSSGLLRMLGSATVSKVASFIKRPLRLKEQIKVKTIRAKGI